VAHTVIHTTIINQEDNRLKQSWDDDVKKSIREVLESLRKQPKSVDSQLSKMLETYILKTLSMNSLRLGYP